MTARAAAAGRLAAVLVVGAGLVLGASRVPTSALNLSSGSPQKPVSTRPVSAAELVCPGQETLGVPGDVSGTAPAPAVVSAATPPAAVAGSDAAGGKPVLSAATVPVQGHEATTVFEAPATSGSVTTAAAASVRATGSAARGLVADQVTFVGSGDLRSLSGAACTPPSTDAWLVGGGGEDGRRGRLVLTNVADNPVDVALHVLSADGPVDSTAGADVAVPAHARVTVLLGALAPSVTSPVVHVTTTGGAVAATLHDARLHGTTAWGTDDVAAGTAPSRTVLVPGVAVDGTAFVRIAVPGSDEAVAQVRLLGQDGQVVAPENGVVRVPGGSVRDLDLSTLPAGTYGVEVTADVPVVAGAMVERRRDADGVADIAWLSSAPSLTGEEHVLGFAPASAGSQALTVTLALTAPTRDASVELVSGTSPLSTVRVATGTTTLVTVPADQATFVRTTTGSGPVAAARLLTSATPAGDLITASSLWPAPLVQHLTRLAPAS
ncbi:MAG TPA: DUF5719 family protein [Actinomycetales bacterium]|nr:DUF5719 family protein [Actinomycetales bacterium]